MEEESGVAAGVAVTLSFTLWDLPVWTKTYVF